MRWVPFLLFLFWSAWTYTRFFCFVLRGRVRGYVYVCVYVAVGCMGVVGRVDAARLQLRLGEAPSLELDASSYTIRGGRPDAQAVLHVHGLPGTTDEAFVLDDCRCVASAAVLTLAPCRSPLAGAACRSSARPLDRSTARPLGAWRLALAVRLPACPLTRWRAGAPPRGSWPASLGGTGPGVPPADAQGGPPRARGCGRLRQLAGVAVGSVRGVGECGPVCGTHGG